MEIALVEMEEGEQGSLAGSLENIDLDIDHMQVIHLEGAVATLGVAEDTEVVLEEHAQGCAAGCGCQRLSIAVVVDRHRPDSIFIRRGVNLVALIVNLKDLDGARDDIDLGVGLLGIL